MTLELICHSFENDSHMIVTFAANMELNREVEFHNSKGSENNQRNESESNCPCKY